jgi:chaperonin GroES
VNLRPTGENIVIIPIDGENQLESGIILPENRIETIQEGRVWAIGPGITQDQLKVDEIVIYSKYAGQEYKVQGTSFVLIKWKDVLGIRD